MNDRELVRDRLAKFLAEGEGLLWDDVFPRVPWEVWAEQVLAEIEAAGYVLMERGRAERLRVVSVAAERAVNCEPGRHCANWHERLQDAVDALQSGDLDPLEGVKDDE